MSNPKTQPAIALDIRGLKKTFDKPAVNDLDLQVKRGEFYALLGPNGAGKTTCLRMVAGLLQPDAGEISVCGINALHDPVNAKAQIAWVSDEPLVYDRLTPLEYLRFIAGLWHVDAKTAESRAHELLHWLKLTEQANSHCGGFSKGMLQKVALAGALIHEPSLIILDEPLTGLDAGSARDVKNVLKQKVSQGVTIVMTTHILEVAERMADRIGVIANGQLIGEGTLAELQSKASGKAQSAESSLEDVFLNLVAQQDQTLSQSEAA